MGGAVVRQFGAGTGGDAVSDKVVDELTPGLDGGLVGGGRILVAVLAHGLESSALSGATVGTI